MRLKPLVGNVLRITPACAGRSPPKKMIKVQSGDHLRVCGEKQAGTVNGEP